MKNLLKNIFIAGIALTIFSCSSDDNNGDDNSNVEVEQTIKNIAAANPDLSILVEALTKTNLATTLNGKGQFTVFAPTNEAFETFFESLGENVDVKNVDVTILKNVLLNHVIAEKITSINIPAEVYKSTLLPFNSSTNAPTISMFIQKSGDVVTLNGGITKKGAVVTKADIEATNGVIHVVNKVIQIPNVYDHLMANPIFNRFSSSLNSQNLQSLLEQNIGGVSLAPFTVFAPDDNAFRSKIGFFYTRLESVTRTNILKRHLVSRLNFRSNTTPTLIESLSELSYMVTGTSITIETYGNFNIILPDVQCSNGVVHGIDKFIFDYSVDDDSDGDDFDGGDGGGGDDDDKK